MLSSCLQRLHPAFEVFAQRHIGAGAVERGPVHPGERCEGFHVASAAGWDVAGDQLVGGGTDPLLVEHPLPGGQPHGSSCSSAALGGGWVAASMPAMTRIARS